MTVPFNVTQPSLVLNQSIVLNGRFPARDGYADGTSLGMIVTTGFFNQGTDLTNLIIPAQGQNLWISQNTSLFSILGISYGGNGQSYFSLPSLGAASILGASSPNWNGFWQNSGPVQFLGEINGSAYPEVLTNLQLPESLGGSSIPVNNLGLSQSLQYLIQAQGTLPMDGLGVPAGTVGVIVPFAGTYVPGGFVACNGQVLNIEDFPTLYSVLGTTYGGDGINTFGVPNLTNHVPIGTGGQYTIGQTTGSSTITLVPVPDTQASSTNIFQTVSAYQPSLAVHYIINLEGIFGGLESGTATLGQIMMFAGEKIPKGWTLCEGQLLSIEHNPALFSLIGIAFGGDGESNFALPDLRDRTIIGSGSPTGGYYGPYSVDIGDVIGQSQITLSYENLPPIFVPAPGLSLLNDTGHSNDDLITNISDIDVSGVWPQAVLEYSLDGKTWSSTLQASEGKNSISVRQVDYIGQASAASQTLTFNLDTKAPSAPSLSLQEGMTRNVLGLGTQEIPQSLFGALSIKGVEDGATSFYSVDGGIKWTEHFSAQPGLNHVQVKQADRAGNISEPSAIFSFEYLGSENQQARVSVSPQPDGGRRIDVMTPGLLPDALGTGAKDVVYFNLQSSLILPGTIEDVVLTGLGAGNKVQGHAGDNSFAIASGSWFIEGGSGQDRIIIDGLASDYTMRSGFEDGEEVTLLFGPSGKIIIHAIERIECDDATFAASTSPSASHVHALYQAVLDRSPDAQGFQIWQAALEQGANLSSIASDFLSSQEALGRYGQAQTNADFITSLYHNALGRNPDALGFHAWNAALDKGHLSRADMVIGIIGSQEARALASDTYFVLV